jgi:hypothetical protein
MKYCVVTYIFNNYEILKDPLEIDPDCDYICFTDDASLTSSGTFKIIYLKELDTDKLTGVQKMLALKYQIYRYIPDVEKYDYIVRLDGSIAIYKSLRPIVEYMNNWKYDISVAPHYKRDNYIDEYNTWISARNLNPAYYNMFQLAISKSSYNYSVSGLIETTVQIYRNCKEIYNFLDDLYSMMVFYVNNEDNNDQGWFTFALYQHFDKLRVNFHHPTLYRYSPYMAVCNHGTISTYHNSPVSYPQYILFFDKPVKVNNIEDYTKTI